MRRLFSRRRFNSDSGPSRPRPAVESGRASRRSLENLSLSDPRQSNNDVPRQFESEVDEFDDDVPAAGSDTDAIDAIGASDADGNDNGSDVDSRESAPLSESRTLFNSNQERLQLQASYNENFSLYLPFLIRRVRLESMYTHSDLSSSQETIASVVNKYSIMNQSTHSFNEKRQMILVHEILKNSSLIFVNQDAFSLFKEIRGMKKEKASAVAPAHYRRGMGLPLMKMESHTYLRREDGADIIFHKSCEASSSAAADQDYAYYKFCVVHIKNVSSLKRYTFTFTPQDAPSFKVILFQHNFKPIADFNYKNTRFRLFGNSMINYGLAPNFKMLVIDKDKPSLFDSLIEKPQFRLSSLVKRRRSSASSASAAAAAAPPPPKPSSDLRGPTASPSLSATSSRRGSSVSRRGSAVAIAEDPNEEAIDDGDDDTSNEAAEPAPVDPTTMSNPYPLESNPLLKYDQHEYLLRNKSYVSNDMPPFGSFQDAICYTKEYTLLPKKFKEQGRFEVYQDSSVFTSNTNLSSTASVDIDTLVLSCLTLSIREVVIKRNSKVNSNVELVNRYNYMSGGIYANHGAGILGGF